MNTANNSFVTVPITDVGGSTVLACIQCMEGAHSPQLSDHSTHSVLLDQAVTWFAHQIRPGLTEILRFIRHGGNDRDHHETLMKQTQATDPVQPTYRRNRMPSISLPDGSRRSRRGSSFIRTVGMMTEAFRSGRGELSVKFVYSSMCNQSPFIIDMPLIFTRR